MAKTAPLGTMDQRVVIQQPSTVSDTQGGRAVTWSTLATVWAAIRPWSRAGMEQLSATAVTATGAYEVEIQYRTDVTPAMRLSWTPYRGSAKTFEILEVVNSAGRPDRLFLQCAERQ